MSSTIKNIIILVAIALVLFLAYFFFFNGAPQQASLTSSSTVPITTTDATGTNSAAVGSEFLTVLLNVKTIKLDDSIFSDPAFATLHDSSIQLVSDGTEGRTNPFAPIGSDTSPASTNVTTPTNSTAPSVNIPSTTNPLTTQKLTP